MKKEIGNRAMDSAPLSDKIDLVRSLILQSVDKDILKKIYLFGSYAYGIPKKDSDIDLCVVVDNDSKRTKIYLNIAKKMYENKIIPCDLLVYNERYFNNSNNPEGIENTIIKKGKLLYG